MTKRYIVRVCRQWYNLALPYFYEYILLGRTKTLNPLLSAFKASATRSGQPFGWWTKRLDVLLRDGIPKPEQAFCDLAEIMQELPNLEIWNLALSGGSLNNRALPADLFQKAHRCGHSLRVVNFLNRMTVSGNPGVWGTFLDQHPNMRYLTYNPEEEVPLPAAPSLVCVWNPWSYQVDYSLLASRYPNLHMVILDLPQHDTLRLRDPLNQITHLQLLVPPWAIVTFTQELRLLKQIFSRLNRLEFVFRTMDADISFNQCPLATHITFRSSSHNFSRQNAISIFSTGIPDLCKVIPSLKTVQFMDKADLVSLSQVARQIRAPLTALQEMGLQVVDDEGRQLMF